MLFPLLDPECNESYCKSEDGIKPRYNQVGKSKKRHTYQEIKYNNPGCQDNPEMKSTQI
jgi:hypothetical protein